MLKGMVGGKLPTLENLGQIADNLGLNAILMKLPTAHLGRLSLPALLELPEHQACFCYWRAKGPLRVIDPCEERDGLIC